MGLLFGKLTQDFIDFEATLDLLGSSDPAVAAQAALGLPVVAASFKASAANNALYLVYIGVGVLFSVYAYMNVWVYTAETSSKRLREQYLAAVLRQDIAFFDNVGAGEVATRIQTDTRKLRFSQSMSEQLINEYPDLFQQGVSEKICLAAQYLSSFFAGI